MTQDQNSGSGAAMTAPRLLSSNRVEGLTVYSREGDKLGSVAKPVEEERALPWRLATFNLALDGYTIAVEKATLSSGPSFKHASDAVFDGAYTDRVDSYYQANGPMR